MAQRLETGLSLAMTTRSVLVTCHRWVGLVFGVLLFLQGLTGASIAFRDELNRALFHDALVVEPLQSYLPVQTLIETVRRAHPQLYVERIEYPKHRDESLVFRMETKGAAHQRYIAVDPYRGTITRDAATHAWPPHWLFWLHQQLLAGHTGETIVGIMGLALLFLAVTAPFVWWPGRRNLKRGFTVTVSAGKYRGLRDLHRVGGIVVVLLLLTWASTGPAIVWKTEIQAALARSVPIVTKPAPKVAERADTQLLPLDEIIATARQRYGDAPIKNVRFPGGHGRVVAVFFETPSTTRPRASDQIWLDAYTASTLGLYEAGSLPTGNVVLDWMLPIHSGEVFGIVGRVVFLLGALCLSGLALTGVWQWFERRRLRSLPPVTEALNRANLLDVVVARAWEETPAVRALELRAADGGELPSFEAGAHVDVYLMGDIIRQYSIWSDQNERTRYCIAVLRTPDSRGGSVAAHALQPGARIKIAPPRNTFSLIESAPASVLVAGGIGVTPMIAMASRLAVLRRPFTMHYCARRREDAAFVPRLQAVAGEGALTLHFSDEPHPGRFHARAVLAAAPPGAHVYVCGPARLIESVLTAGRELGWSEDRLHSEFFKAAPVDADAPAFDLHLIRSGRVLHVSAQQTALDVLVAHGIGIPSSCGQGICGTCVTKVLDGVPDHRDRYLTPAEHDSGTVFTPCCSRARTPVLVVDL
jgi:vanillate O-demethylase ferredoxin subunit